MKSLLAFAPAALLAACVSTPLPEPIAEGMPAGIGESVTVGRLVATPLRVAEDSRCPANARCIWAGRVVVDTRLTAADWSESAALTLGEPYATHGTTVTLVSVRPEKFAERDIPKNEYRFVYEGGR